MTDRIYDMLKKMDDRQYKIAKDVSKIQEHLRDINSKVQCHEDDIRGLKTKVAMASGGLSALMLLLLVLSYFGVV